MVNFTLLFSGGEEASQGRGGSGGAGAEAAARGALHLAPGKGDILQDPKLNLHQG